MKQPWDIPEPPTPEAADTDINTVYAAVGEALSAWEHLEESLAQLFSIFIGLHSGSVAAERAYGSVTAFASRKGMLEQVAEVYFRHHPDTESQNLFKDIIEAAGNFSARRNDIAHAKVMSFLRPGDEKIIFLLWPAFYNSNKINWRGSAKFVYNSAIVSSFTGRFNDIQQTTRALIRTIEQRHDPMPAEECVQPVYE